MMYTTGMVQEEHFFFLEVQQRKMGTKLQWCSGSSRYRAALGWTALRNYTTPTTVCPSHRAAQMYHRNHPYYLDCHNIQSPIKMGLEAVFNDRMIWIKGLSLKSSSVPFSEPFRLERITKSHQTLLLYVQSYICTENTHRLPCILQLHLFATTYIINTILRLLEHLRSGRVMKGRASFVLTWLYRETNIPALCFSTLHPHPSSLGVSSGIPTQWCTRLLTNTSLVRSFLLLSLLSW